MDVEIRPQPQPGEREAILAALEPPEPMPDAYRSAWRLAALHEVGQPEGDVDPLDS